MGKCIRCVYISLRKQKQAIYLFFLANVATKEGGLETKTQAGVKIEIKS